MAQKPFSTLDLTGKYIEHDVPIYCHNHPTQPDGINACAKDIETALQAFDLDDWALGGDMTKAVYDVDNDGIVDKAEALNDGTNTVTAAALRDHLDNHPSSGDTVGGLVTVASSRAALAEECAGHLLEITAAGVTVTLPDVSTLPDNARITLANDASANVFTVACSGTNNIFWQGSTLASFTSPGSRSYIILRKVTGGWLCVGSYGFFMAGE